MVRVTSLEAASAFAELAIEMAGGELSAIELLPEMGVRRVCDELLRCRPPMPLIDDWYVLCRVAGQQELQYKLEAIVIRAIELELAADAILAQSSTQETQLWTIRDMFSDLHKHLGLSYRFDYAVPVGRIPQLYRQLCERIAAIEPDFVPLGFGHLGDGNLHFSACQPVDGDRTAYENKRDEIEAASNAVVWSLGGTVSAEHGVGQLHRAELSHQKDPVGLAMMHHVKHALDPRGLFNPGKLLPPAAHTHEFRTL